MRQFGIHPSCDVATMRNGFPAGRDGDTASDAVLKFKPITLSDLPLINDLLQKGASRTCDYTVGGIFMWVDYFKYQYAVVDSTLFIKGMCENRPGLEAFALPIGDLSLREAVGLLKEYYCRAEDAPLRFSAIPEDKIDLLASYVPGRVELLDDWFDYLYDINALASLSGKALSKKRNHVNRFICDNPEYLFEPLVPSLIPELIIYYSGRPMTPKADFHLALYEREQCVKVLNHFCSYPFEGAVLRGRDGDVVAFTVGEIIGDTLYVHIEKMSHDVPGAGEAVNKLFAQAMLRKYPKLKYVNREEDMGDPGLRYAKNSYRPLSRLYKYNIV